MADETYPQELQYYKEHDWVRVEGEDAVFGITWFAQDALGEIVYAELPAVGRQRHRRRAIRRARVGQGRERRVRAARAARSSRSTRRSQDEPQRVNEDCYGEGWLIRVRLTAPGEIGELMDADAYKAFLDEA